MYTLFLILLPLTLPPLRPVLSSGSLLHFLHDSGLTPLLWYAFTDLRHSRDACLVDRLNETRNN